MREKCPYCGSYLIEITCMDNPERIWLCSGPEVHEWRGELPGEGERVEPLIVLSK